MSNLEIPSKFPIDHSIDYLSQKIKNVGKSANKSMNPIEIGKASFQKIKGSDLGQAVGSRKQNNTSASQVVAFDEGNFGFNSLEESYSNEAMNLMNGRIKSLKPILNVESDVIESQKSTEVNSTALKSKQTQTTIENQSTDTAQPIKIEKIPKKLQRASFETTLPELSNNFDIIEETDNPVLAPRDRPIYINSTVPETQAIKTESTFNTEKPSVVSSNIISTSTLQVMLEKTLITQEAVDLAQMRHYVKLELKQSLDMFENPNATFSDLVTRRNDLISIYKGILGNILPAIGIEHPQLATKDYKTVQRVIAFNEGSFNSKDREVFYLKEAIDLFKHRINFLKPNAIK